MCRRIFFIFAVCVLPSLAAVAQSIRWSEDGNSFFQVEEEAIVQYTPSTNDRKILADKRQLTPPGGDDALDVQLFSLSTDQKKLLIYTNSQRVWRINTRGDYWVLDLGKNTLKKLGDTFPASSLMFAKFSPDATKVAYVSQYNLYVEDLATNMIRPLTTDGNRKFINGTFDWVYEEEFACRDGFRWSPDGRSIAFWQIDARKTRDFYMINYTDSVYSRIIPVEYPKVGESPSACRIGMIDISTAATTWMKIEGDPWQNYIVRLEFIPGTSDFIIQQLNRKQNVSRLIRCAGKTGSCRIIHTEQDDAWVDVYGPASAENAYNADFRHDINWVSGGKEFLWTSEKSGWRHIYKISSEGKETAVTKGSFDVIALKSADERSGLVYFLASPSNATQKYLYRVRMDGRGNAEPVDPAALKGTHNYIISPSGRIALHSYTNVSTERVGEVLSLPSHRPFVEKESIAVKIEKASQKNTTEFFRVRTEDGIEMDGWMVKPNNFDPAKKYPVVFSVYTEPWDQSVTDTYDVGQNFMYAGDMREDGYIYLAVDNRGTPAPKGRAWRKSIYRNIGLINIRDQAMAAKEIMKWPFVDSSRIAVWGWSGGGSATLNLMFQYPDIYKTGIAVAAVSNQLTYDNIYQERYMGLPQENLEDFVKGSPVTHAKNLKGDLLYIHGTADDNVHYANAEMLINELVRHNKQFRLMIYPNRSHGMSEGEGTFEHLVTLYTQFLKTHCPPGGR